MTTIESLLLKLGAEGAEVAHIVEKCLQFGLDEVNHFDPTGPTNRQRLIGELNDILGAAAMLVEAAVLPDDWASDAAIAKKCGKIAHYTNYSRQIGTVTGPRARVPKWALRFLDLPPTPFEKAVERQGTVPPDWFARAHAAAVASNKAHCPHCGATLLFSEDRGPHCDGCDDFNPEVDLPPSSAFHGPFPGQPDNAVFSDADLSKIKRIDAENFGLTPTPVCSIVNEKGVHCDRPVTHRHLFGGRELPFCFQCFENVRAGAYGVRDVPPHSCPEKSQDGPCLVCHQEAAAIPAPCTECGLLHDASETCEEFLRSKDAPAPNLDGPVPTRPVILRGPSIFTCGDAPECYPPAWHLVGPRPLCCSEADAPENEVIGSQPIEIYRDVEINEDRESHPVRADELNRFLDGAIADPPAAERWLDMLAQTLPHRAEWLKHLVKERADKPRRIWAMDPGRWVDQHGNAWPVDATGNPIDS